MYIKIEIKVEGCKDYLEGRPESISYVVQLCLIGKNNWCLTGT